MKHKGFVVFLDVDGVLNTRTTCQRSPDGYTGIDDARVDVLSKTINKYGGGDIVLSSDWKELNSTDKDYKYLVSKLEMCGLCISGKTIDSKHDRGAGIVDYLNNHPEIEDFVILDDCTFDLEFEDYTTDELCDITKLMVSEKQMTITDAAMNKLRKNFDIVREETDYGNGRFVRKMLEEAEMNLAERVLQYKEYEITNELVTTIEECDIPNRSTRKRAVKRIGFAC